MSSPLTSFEVALALQEHRIRQQLLAHREPAVKAAPRRTVQPEPEDVAVETLRSLGRDDGKGRLGIGKPAKPVQQLLANWVERCGCGRAKPPKFKRCRKCIAAQRSSVRMRRYVSGDKKFTVERVSHVA